MLFPHRVARENAPEGFDPCEVDSLDVEAGDLLGLSKEEAIEVGHNEALRRMFQHARIGIQKKLAEQK